MPLADPNADTPASENPRRDVVRFLAERLDPGESGFFRAKHVRDATDMTGSQAGCWLARFAGVHDDPRYPDRPSPCFDVEVWTNSGSGRQYRVTRRVEYRADRLSVGGEA